MTSAVALVVALLLSAALVLVAVGWMLNAWFGPPAPFPDLDDGLWGPPAPPPVRSNTPVFDRVKAERDAETAALERLWTE